MCAWLLLIYQNVTQALWAYVKHACQAFKTSVGFLGCMHGHGCCDDHGLTWTLFKRDVLCWCFYPGPLEIKWWWFHTISRSDATKHKSTTCSCSAQIRYLQTSRYLILDIFGEWEFLKIWSMFLCSFWPNPQQADPRSESCKGFYTSTAFESVSQILVFSRWDRGWGMDGWSGPEIPLIHPILLLLHNFFFLFSLLPLPLFLHPKIFFTYTCVKTLLVVQLYKCLLCASQIRQLLFCPFQLLSIDKQISTLHPLLAGLRAHNSRLWGNTLNCDHWEPQEIDAKCWFAHQSSDLKCRKK